VLRTERQSARMSKIKNGGLDQYGAEPLERQQIGTAGIERVNRYLILIVLTCNARVIDCKCFCCCCFHALLFFCFKFIATVCCE